MDKLIEYQKKINDAHENRKICPFFYGYADFLIDTGGIPKRFHCILSKMVMEWYPKFWFRHVIDDLNLRPDSVYLQELISNWN